MIPRYISVCLSQIIILICQITIGWYQILKELINLLTLHLLVRVWINLLLALKVNNSLTIKPLIAKLVPLASSSITKLLHVLHVPKGKRWIQIPIFAQRSWLMDYSKPTWKAQTLSTTEFLLFNFKKIMTKTNPNTQISKIAQKISQITMDTLA